MQGLRPVSLAQGMVYLALTLAAWATCSQITIWRGKRLAHAHVAVPACTAPIAVETRWGSRLGCADEARLALCAPVAFDAVRLGPKGCVREASGMPQAWYVSLGLQLDINRAQTQQLAALPGIGAKRAEAIVRHRRLHGPYASIDGLAAVPGVGPARMRQLRAVCRVDDGG